MKLKVHFYEQFKECPYKKCEFFKEKNVCLKVRKK